MLLAKTKLHTFEILISITLINSYSNHDELISVNNVLRIYKEMKEDIKNPEDTVKMYYITTMKMYCVN